MAHATGVDSLRADARRLATVIGAATGVLWIPLILERLGAPAAWLAQNGAENGTLRDVMRRLIAASPDVAYLIALHFIRIALASFARGDFFAPIVPRMLSRVGAMLAIGAFASTFLVPL